MLCLNSIENYIIYMTHNLYSAVSFLIDLLPLYLCMEVKCEVFILWMQWKEYIFIFVRKFKNLRRLATRPTSDIVYGELERFPLQLQRYFRIINYWLK